GYDCFDRLDVPRLLLPRLDPAVLGLATVEPRRCGFHAKLVAPFRLNGSHQADVAGALEGFARTPPPVPIGPLAGAPIGSYVALVPAQPDAKLAEFAAACLKDLDRFSAPLTPAERERRTTNGLTERQLQLLARWGDAHVLDQFQFQLRLVGPISSREAELFKAILSGAFAMLAHDHVELDGISLMRQDDAGKRFFVSPRPRLTGV